MIDWAVSVSEQEKSCIACAHAHTPHHCYQTEIQENSVPQLRAMSQIKSETQIKTDLR